MLGLTRKENKQVVQARVKTNRRRSVRTILVPTMIGSMMIMRPWRVGDGSPEYPDTIPPID